MTSLDKLASMEGWDIGEDDIGTELKSIVLAAFGVSSPKDPKSVLTSLQQSPGNKSIYFSLLLHKGDVSF